MILFCLISFFILPSSLGLCIQNILPIAAATANLAGYFEGKGNIAINGGGIRLRCTFQKACEGGTPAQLEYIRSMYGGNIIPTTSSMTNRKVWMLEYSSKETLKQLLSDSV